LLYSSDLFNTLKKKKKIFLLVTIIDGIKKATAVNNACESLGRAEPLKVLIEVNTTGEFCKYIYVYKHLYIFFKKYLYKFYYIFKQIIIIIIIIIIIFFFYLFFFFFFFLGGIKLYKYNII